VIVVVGCLEYGDLGVVVVEVDCCVGLFFIDCVMVEEG